MLPSNSVTVETVHSYGTLISLSSMGATLAYELHILSVFVPFVWQHVIGNAENCAILTYRYKVPLCSVKINEKILMKRFY
jgi:hypothetical protein